MDGEPFGVEGLTCCWALFKSNFRGLNTNWNQSFHLQISFLEIIKNQLAYLLGGCWLVTCWGLLTGETFSGMVPDALFVLVDLFKEILSFLVALKCYFNQFMLRWKIMVTYGSVCTEGASICGSFTTTVSSVLIVMSEKKSCSLLYKKSSMKLIWS